jgi:hypothetical protein
MKHRNTREVIIGGVLGLMTRTEVVIAGLYRGDDLVVVGRTVPLHPRQAAEQETGDDGKRRYTVAQIAAEFGVTRPTIYQTFPTPASNSDRRWAAILVGLFEILWIR